MLCRESRGMLFLELAIPHLKLSAYFAIVLVLLAAWNECSAQSNQFESKQELFEEASEQFSDLSDDASDIWDDAAEKLIECSAMPSPEREDCLMRLAVIMASMDIVQIQSNEAQAAFDWLKSEHLNTVNAANEKNLGSSNYDRLKASERVPFSESAALIEHEIQLVEAAIDAILPSIMVAQIAAVHPELDELVMSLFQLQQVFEDAEQKSEEASAHARGESGMIAALTLVNFLAKKPEWYFDTQYSGYDQFADARIHAGFQLQSFKLTLDDQQNALFTGGRFYRGYALGYEIPAGTYLQNNLFARRNPNRELIAVQGSRIYADPGYDRSCSNIRLYESKNRIDVKNIGISMHMRPDEQLDPDNEVFIIAHGDPICEGQSSLYPQSNIDVTWEPGDTETKISNSFTVFVTGGNRFIAGASESDPDYFKFHITIEASKLVPTDPCWVWDPELKLYFYDCGGSGTIN